MPGCCEILIRMMFTRMIGSMVMSGTGAACGWMHCPVVQRNASIRAIKQSESSCVSFSSPDSFCYLHGKLSVRSASFQREVPTQQCSPRLEPPILIERFQPYRGHVVNTSNKDLAKNNQQPIRHVAAPMVAASDFAFRCLCRQHSHVDLSFSQMLHARNILRDKCFVRNHFDFYETTIQQHPYDGTDHVIMGSRFPEITTEAQFNFLEGDDPDKRQLPPSWIPYTRGSVVAQLAGHDPVMVVDAAQRILEWEPQGFISNGCTRSRRVQGIDLNLGCPQGIARKGQYGAFLMDQKPEIAYRVLKALRQELPADVTVSAKIRLPVASCDDGAVLHDRVQRLLDTGINFLTIHGRTLRENKVAVGPCHLDAIQKVVQYAQQHHGSFFPVIANGGVEFHSDVSDILQRTGATAVMSSEALLQTPDVFQHDLHSLSPRQMLQQQLRVARDYLHWCRCYPPLPGVLGHRGGSFNVVRGHLFKMLHRYVQMETDLRDRLASPYPQRGGITRLVEAEELINELDCRFATLSEADLAAAPCSQPDASWYRRHRNSPARVHALYPLNESSVRVQVSAVVSTQYNGVSPRPQPLRGSTNLVSLADMTVEERKVVLQERIAALRQSNQTRQQLQRCTNHQEQHSNCRIALRTEPTAPMKNCNVAA